MYGVHHGIVLVRAGDGGDIGEACTDHRLFAAHAAGDDNLAVFRQCLADGVQAFFLRGIEEPAGIDDNDVSAGIGGRRVIAFTLQARQDALGIDQGLGAAERDEAHLGLRLFWGIGNFGHDGTGHRKKLELVGDDILQSSK